MQHSSFMIRHIDRFSFSQILVLEILNISVIPKQDDQLDKSEKPELLLLEVVIN